MKILIADDHELVREGLKQILAHALPKAIFGEAADARHAIERVEQEPWDLVMLDLTMPGRSGLDTLKDIKTLRPSLPVLILTGHPEDQFAVRALRAGAAGYVTKESSSAQLVAAVKRVLAGGRYVSPTLAERLANEVASKGAGDKAPHEVLSDREFQVLRRIASGKTVKTIAAELSLSVKTVSTYRARVLAKMHMRTNAELTHYAVRAGLVDALPM